MKPLTASHIRPASLIDTISPKLHHIPYRSYATHHTLGSLGTSPSSSSSPNTKRRAVTPFNDTGAVPWSQLSPAEKTARAAQQSFNFTFILLGLSLTGIVSYFLYTEVFSPDSKTAYFNRAVDRIRVDPTCNAALGGSGKDITAFGEETFNKWRRARPIASTLKKDGRGNEHLMMHFNVQGPKAKGVVQMHLVRRAGGGEFQYSYFYLDVPGKQRVYLENPDGRGQKGEAKGSTRLFGIQWGSG